ncbi:MAG: hypothetical protein ACP6IY_10680 [Promethearchaeia archaeon]
MELYKALYKKSKEIEKQINEIDNTINILKSRKESLLERLRNAEKESEYSGGGGNITEMG